MELWIADALHNHQTVTSASCAPASSSLSAAAKEFIPATQCRMPEVKRANPVNMAAASDFTPLVPVPFLVSATASSASVQQQRAHQPTAAELCDGFGVFAAEQRPDDTLLLAGGEVFYCQFCAISCAAGKWSEHCASEEHLYRIRSDRDRCWNYRQPPRHLNSEQYRLCIAHFGDPNNSSDPGTQYCVNICN